MQQGFRPPVPRPVTIEGPSGPLEGRVEDPAEDSRPAAVGVICHPHPLHGGTMHNKVVHTVARAMQQLGTPTLRFNFRGVGRSAGQYGHGIEEVYDALAACEWARRRFRCDALWLAGFSFGAAIALQAAGQARPAKLVTVAPPVGRLLVTPVARPPCPWLVVQGDRDELVELPAVEAWVAGFDEQPRLVVLPGAEHFFHGRLVELRAEVLEFLVDPVAAED